MKNLIIYASIHQGNTKKVADKMGEVLNAKVVSFSEINRKEIEEADLVGFGSGIYFSRFHKGLSKLVDNLPAPENKKAFIFSTSGMKAENIFNTAHSHFKKKLKKKGFQVAGEFNCPGYDTYSVLKLVGGVNKNRPNSKDMDKAEKFARGLYERFSE
jgi:flavodoxin